MTVVAIIIWVRNHCDVCDHATVLVLIYNVICLPFNIAVAGLAWFTLKYPARMKGAPPTHWSGSLPGIEPCLIPKGLCKR